MENQPNPLPDDPEAVPTCGSVPYRDFHHQFLVIPKNDGQRIVSVEIETTYIPQTDNGPL
jgi:hypothetical protein